MKCSDPSKCSWYPFIDEPLVEGLSYAPRFSYPQVIMPSDSCDGKWHMFFQSWIGIHHFVSDSGIAWEPRKVVEFRGHCPSIFKQDETFYLIYEKHDRDYPLLNSRRADGKNERFSRIEMKVSTDLVTWSKSRVLLEGKDVPYSSDYRKNPRLSCPQLFESDEGYRLYFASSSVRMPDSGFVTPRYFSCAFSNDIFGPYTIDKDSIIMQSNGDDKAADLASGNIRLVSHCGKMYAFECGAYWDEQNRKSLSALTILESDDGLNFTRCSSKPVLLPSQEGWASSYITSCDVHFKEDEQCWYCYFTATCDKATRLTKESIGLLIGKVI